MSTPRQILEAVEAAIVAAATTARPWHLVPVPADLYESAIPELGDGAAHYGFAVGVPSSDGLRLRQAASEAVSSTILVVWSRVLGAQRQAEDYREGLDDEKALLAVVTALSTSGRNPILKSLSRRATSTQASGLLVGRIQCSIPHVYSLA
jgi:hypothetical protein